MKEFERLPDEELGLTAAAWRKRALRGERQARGMAHELEAELRRRSGRPSSASLTLEMRSLEIWLRRPPRWQFWRRAR